MKTTRTPEQERIAEKLSLDFGIDKDRIYFVGQTEPWLPADVLTALARESDDVQSVIESFDQFIPQLSQIVHQATVMLKDGRSFTRTGIASLGEKLPSGGEADEHGLAASRAIGAALTAAGKNPLRAVLKPAQQQGPQQNEQASRITMDPDSRISQVRQIHKLAEKVGLIRQGDDGQNDTSKYEEFLIEGWGVDSVAGMDSTQRSSVINKLTILERRAA